MATTRRLACSAAFADFALHSWKWHQRSHRSAESLFGCWRYSRQHWGEDQIPLQTQTPYPRGTSRGHHHRKRSRPHLEMHRRRRLYIIQLRHGNMSWRSLLWLAENWCRQHLDQEGMEDHYLMADDHTQWHRKAVTHITGHWHSRSRNLRHWNIDGTGNFIQCLGISRSEQQSPRDHEHCPWHFPSQCWQLGTRSFKVPSRQHCTTLWWNHIANTHFASSVDCILVCMFECTFCTINQCRTLFHMVKRREVLPMLRTQLVLRANNNAWCVFRFHFSFSPQLQHISSNKHPHFFSIPCLLQIAAPTPKFSASLAWIPQIQWHIVMHLPFYFVFQYRSAHPFVSMSTWRKQQTCSTAWSLTITKRRKHVKTMAHSGNQMMHSMRQCTRPNYSPWHFWMDTIALQLLWSKPWTISKDEQSYNLPSRTSKIYIHLWSKKTWNRSLFGFSTNMHPFSDTPDNHSISSYKDWISLRTPPAVPAHHMGRHNKSWLPAREKKTITLMSYLHSCFRHHSHFSFHCIDPNFSNCNTWSQWPLFHNQSRLKHRSFSLLSEWRSQMAHKRCPLIYNDNWQSGLFHQTHIFKECITQTVLPEFFSDSCTDIKTYSMNLNTYTLVVQTIHLTHTTPPFMVHCTPFNLWPWHYRLTTIVLQHSQWKWQRIATP